MAPNVPATTDEKATADNVLNGPQRRWKAGRDGVENERTAWKNKFVRGNLFNIVEDIYKALRGETDVKKIYELNPLIVKGCAGSG